MAKTSKTKGFEKLSDPEKYLVAGPGGGTHQTAVAAQDRSRPIKASSLRTIKIRGRKLRPIKRRSILIHLLRSHGKAKPMLKGRKIGALVTDSADGDRLEALRAALEKEGAELAIVAPKIGGVRPKSGKPLAVDIALSGAPSVFFDAAAIFASAEGIKPLLKNSAAIEWVRDASGQLKVIGHMAAARPLFGRPGIADDPDEGVIELDARASIAQYIEAAKRQRVWDREARLSGDDT